jgi:hypothetical protein
MRTVLLTVLLAACGGAPTETEPAIAAVTPKVETRHEAEEEDDEGEADEAEEVGPDGPAHLAVPSITLSTDPAVIAQGEALFAQKGCNACHQFGSKLVGPDLNGVTTRRTVPWIERMIRHPDVMTKEDPVAKGLFRSHLVQMPNQGVADEDMTALISFLNSKGATQ